VTGLTQRAWHTCNSDSGFEMLTALALQEIWTQVELNLTTLLQSYGLSYWKESGLD